MKSILGPYVDPDVPPIIRRCSRDTSPGTCDCLILLRPKKNESCWGRDKEISRKPGFRKANLHRSLEPSCSMTPVFSMAATSSKAILRASVVFVLLPLALGFAPAISIMHLSASGNKHALTARSPRGPRAVTMNASGGRARETVLEQHQREMRSRRSTTVLRTAVATIAAVCVLGSARPASAFKDGGFMTMPTGDVSAMTSEGLSTHSKVEARVAVPQDFEKTTRQELMAIKVKAKLPSFSATSLESFRDFMLKALFVGASFAAVPWYAFGRKSEMAESGASSVSPQPARSRGVSLPLRRTVTISR